MSKKLKIETCTTAIESPSGNGTIECHNFIVAEAMEKMLEDKKCDPKIAMALAVSAKNALQNHSGQSSNELVFGLI